MIDAEPTKIALKPVWWTFPLASVHRLLGRQNRSGGDDLREGLVLVVRNHLVVPKGFPVVLSGVEAHRRPRLLVLLDRDTVKQELVALVRDSPQYDPVKNAPLVDRRSQPVDALGPGNEILVEMRIRLGSAEVLGEVLVELLGMGFGNAMREDDFGDDQLWERSSVVKPDDGRVELLGREQNVRRVRGPLVREGETRKVISGWEVVGVERAQIDTPSVVDVDRRLDSLSALLGGEDLVLERVSEIETWIRVGEAEFFGWLSVVVVDGVVKISERLFVRVIRCRWRCCHWAKETVVLLLLIKAEFVIAGSVFESLIHASLEIFRIITALTKI